MVCGQPCLHCHSILTWNSSRVWSSSFVRGYNSCSAILSGTSCAQKKSVTCEQCLLTTLPTSRELKHNGCCHSAPSLGLRHIPNFYRPHSRQLSSFTLNTRTNLMHSFKQKSFDKEHSSILLDPFPFLRRSFRTSRRPHQLQE